MKQIAKAKLYTTPFGTYTYRDVPSGAYPVGLVYNNENGYGFLMASPEKAICDQLYIVSPVQNGRELENFLFDDLRIDRDAFWGLNWSDLLEIAACYHSRNIYQLQTFLRRSIKNGSYH